MSDAARLKATVYVGGLDHEVSRALLTEAFLPFGEIVDVTLPKPEVPSSTDHHRGFGYVEFELAADAREAMDNMDQSELLGRIIKVAQAKPQKDITAGLGSKTAVWEQEGWLAKYAVGEDDRTKADNEVRSEAEQPLDPMQGLEKLEYAGPQQE